MRKHSRWCSSLTVLGLILFFICVSGCAETWKGVQRDWQQWSDWDKEFQEKYW